MVQRDSQALDAVFQALAHPARRAMVRRLAAAPGELTLTALAAPLDMTFPAASKHVRVLERAGLVRRKVVGREHRCRLRAEPLRRAHQFTEQFRAQWSARFEALDAVLEEMKRDEEPQ